MTTRAKSPRAEIGARIRELRKERHWTQAQLAELLGISQNYLSVLERGQGSFTAEQLLTVLKHFNVPIDYFVTSKAPVENQIQNALARQGASHLLENTGILPSEQLKSAADAIRETLLSADSARQITSLAPVLVTHARNLNFPKLKAQLAEAGVDRRLPWVVENTLDALARECRRSDLPRRTGVAYAQARLALQSPLFSWATKHASNLPEDILDHDIASEESKDEVRRVSSKSSKRWRILSRLQVEDFIQALRAAYE